MDGTWVNHVHPGSAPTQPRVLEDFATAAAMDMLRHTSLYCLVWIPRWIGPHCRRKTSSSHASARCASCLFQSHSRLTSDHINSVHLDMERTDARFGNLPFIFVHQRVLIRRLCKGSSERRGVAELPTGIYPCPRKHRSAKLKLRRGMMLVRLRIL